MSGHYFRGNNNMLRNCQAPERRPHAVVVETDAEMRRTLRHCLEQEGYWVSEASSREELQARLKANPATFITLALKLSPDDGLAVAREVRAVSDVPIIMISDKGDPLDRVVGFEAGADDYIVKPFDVREVLARVRNVLRRHYRATVLERPLETGGIERYLFDGWILDCCHRIIVSPSGNISHLTASEFKLLTVFVENANRVLTREEIVALMNGPSWFANGRIVDNRVGRLRRKLESVDGGYDMIKSVRGEGYILAAQITPALPKEPAANRHEHLRGNA